MNFEAAPRDAIAPLSQKQLRLLGGSELKSERATAGVHIEVLLIGGERNSRGSCQPDR
jgi:hypothetical protein